MEVKSMLIKASVENFRSFDKLEEITMVSSSKMQTNKNHKIKIKQVNLLKNAVVYGANASGKSNLVRAFAFIKACVAEGIPVNAVNDFCKNREENKSRESVFELQFTVGDKFYAYGFSVILSQRTITGEWLYELLQDGNARNLFSREQGKLPELGEGVSPSTAEKNRFSIYAEDFVGHDSQLFLTEMNRGKKYEEDSKLIFFRNVFGWIMNNIIILNPNTAITNFENYSEQSLETINQLIQTFDTGISEVGTRQISMDELAKMIPPEILAGVITSLKQEMLRTNMPHIQMSWRTAENFFNIKVSNNDEPEISTLLLKHGKSFFDFDFAEESDGTKRIFDLIDMLLTRREDTVYVVDELERSLHPKLTEHFLKLFMDAHEEARMQLVFTTHEDTIMDQNLFRRDEIWFVERDSSNNSNIYSLDRFKERYDKKLSKAYLEGRYGGVPVFSSIFPVKGE